MRQKLRWRRHGAIALPADEDQQFEVRSVPWPVPTEFKEDVFHWTCLIGDRDTQKALWITADHADKVETCAHAAIEVLHSAETIRTAILIDAAKTNGIFWSLVHGLGTSYPAFSQELARMTEERPDGLGLPGLEPEGLPTLEGYLQDTVSPIYLPRYLSRLSAFFRILS
jgi:hypothetical protein